MNPQKPQGNQNSNYNYYSNAYFQPPRIDNVTLNFYCPGNYAVHMDFNPSPEAVMAVQSEARRAAAQRTHRNGPAASATSIMPIGPGPQAPSSPTGRVTIQEQHNNSSYDVVRQSLMGPPSQNGGRDSREMTPMSTHSSTSQSTSSSGSQSTGSSGSQSTGSSGSQSTGSSGSQSTGSSGAESTASSESESPFMALTRCGIF